MLDLFEKEELEYLVNQLLHKKDFYRAAQMWVNGLTLDWGMLYKNKTIRKISLPAYPFRKIEFNLTDKKKNIYQLNNQWATDEKYPQINSRKITLDDPIIFEHRISEQFIYPGVAYIAMLVQSAKTLFENKYCQIENISWLAPVGLRQNETETTLFLEIKQWQAYFIFEFYTELDRQKVVHCTGRLVHNITVNADDSHKRHLDMLKNGRSELLEKNIFTTVLKRWIFI